MTETMQQNVTRIKIITAPERFWSVFMILTTGVIESFKSDLDPSTRTAIRPNIIKSASLLFSAPYLN